MHKALLVEDGEKFWFASLDGEEWLPVNRQPTDDDAAAFEAALNPPSGLLPLRFGRRFLQYKEAVFL